MKPFRFLVSAFLLLAVSFCGCDIPTFSHPLVEPEVAVAPADVLGSYIQAVTEAEAEVLDLDWLGLGDDDLVARSMVFWHVGMAGEGFPPGFIRVLSVEVTNDTKLKLDYSSFVGFTERIGDKLFLHVPLPNETPIQQSHYDRDWNSKDFDGYLIFVLEPTAEGIEKWEFDSDFIIEEIRAKRLAGSCQPRVREAKIDGNDDPGNTGSPEFKVTASANELREFFEKHIDDRLLKKETESYRRVKK